MPTSRVLVLCLASLCACRAAGSASRGQAGEPLPVQPNRPLAAATSAPGATGEHELSCSALSKDEVERLRADSRAPSDLRGNAFEIHASGLAVIRGSR